MNNKIRVFKTNKMKAYDSVDIDLSSIISRSKDLRVADTHGGYLVNKVKLKDGSIGYVWSKNQKFDESKQIKESMLDYEDEVVAPSWLVTGREYIYIKDSKPILVRYTGRGDKSGTYNFAFIKSNSQNFDLDKKGIREYIRYKEGDLPGPFGHNDSPLSGLNKFKNPMESKQFNLMNIVKKVMRENTEINKLIKFLDYPWQEDIEIEFVSLLDQNRGNFKTSNWINTLQYLRGMDKYNPSLSMAASDKFLGMWDDLIK